MKLIKLKEAMTAATMSVEHLADQAGMCSSTVFKARKGNSVNVNTAKRIASALRTNVEKLI